MVTLKTDLTLREQRAPVAQALRSEGLKYREIAERMGLSISYVQDLVKDPEGIGVKARKDSYRGTCTDCGASTDGSNGRAGAPTLCATCAAQKQHDDRYWTRERIIEWIHGSHVAFRRRGRPLAQAISRAPRPEPEGTGRRPASHSAVRLDDREGDAGDGRGRTAVPTTERGDPLMADSGRMFAGDWWKFNGEDAQRVALEPERSDRDEILVTLRGLDGEAGPGSFYLTSANASDLADQLRREVLKKWKP